MRLQALLQPSRTLLAMMIYASNLVFLPLLVMVCFLLSRCLPRKKWRSSCDHWIHQAPILWTVWNNWAIQVAGVGAWDVQLPDQLKKNQPYLVIANHSSWVDILVLYKIFNRKIPPLTFFMKKSLVWALPIAGLACKWIGYPFLERHSSSELRKHPALKQKDKAATREACQKFIRVASSLMNFVEGTRFSQDKHQRQRSPFRHLLKPKAGGVAMVLEEMHSVLAGIIDVTLDYDTQDKSLWNFVKGGFGRITVQARVLPISPDLIGDYDKDRSFRVHFQHWLNAVWQAKDQQLEAIKSDAMHLDSKQTPCSSKH